MVELTGCVSALQSFQINLYEDALKKRDDAHNVLCDALIQYGAVVDDADGDAYDIAINERTNTAE